MDCGNRQHYAFLIACLLFCVAVLVLCDLSLVYKAFFITVIVGILVFLRSLHNALEVPPDFDLEDYRDDAASDTVPLKAEDDDQIEDAEFTELPPEKSFEIDKI